MKHHTLHHITACSFQRSKDAKWEGGTAFLLDAGVHDVQLIVDSSHRPITKPWDYRLHFYQGAITLNLEELSQ